ncbi:hypothetical protein, partial [Pseudobacteroides cellulosolvens]|uniref:hypothetical protein n=1 Tax=Pseudobacteroides cellulosolvens TaxID=35825 RepID=UPI001A9A3B70
DGLYFFSPLSSLHFSIACANKAYSFLIYYRGSITSPYRILARLLPVLRLNQRLGNSGWLGLTMQGFLAEYRVPYRHTLHIELLPECYDTIVTPDFYAIIPRAI